MEKTSFLCIGLIMHDILLKGVQRLPAHWEDMLVGDEVFSDTGGGAANSARTFGRLGEPVALAGAVGRDAFGDLVVQNLTDDHVSLEYLVRLPEASTGLATALVNPEGKRCFVTVRGANKRFSLQHMEHIDFSAYPYIHINGYFQFPALEPDLSRIMEHMKAQGATISFDTASWDSSGRWFETIAPFACYIDYFFANDTQLQKLCNCAAPDDCAAFLLDKGVKQVVAKLGGEGSILYSRHAQPVVTPAYNGNPIVDTTGAGDSFDAAYMLGVSKGWAKERCGAFANTVAGMNCGKLGATSGVPDFQSALSAMRQAYQTTEE